eukprot:CAMPEP_0198115488 /NCGR_PEP_ID=MMETSP1442-20131203/6565_1 /TAXON_ID= /ORGANISM="Craspedostauros australis, Strain CCMP3328" /LENGTH=257 /DNA_ID=CAMNT_0043773005 /DNA_START=324 /DNA_END=1098 /DNA_ORIENTATION=-
MAFQQRNYLAQAQTFVPLRNISVLAILHVLTPFCTRNAFAVTRLYAPHQYDDTRWSRAGQAFSCGPSSDEARDGTGVVAFVVSALPRACMLSMLCSALLYSTLLYPLFFFVLLSVRNFEEDLGLAREPSAVLLVIDDLRHFRPFLGKVKVVQLDVAATDVVIQPDIIIPHLDVQDHVVHRRDLLEGEGLAVLWVEIIRLLARLLRLQGLVVDPAILLEIEDDVRIGLAQKVGVAEVGDFVEEYGQHSHLALCLFVVF